MPSKAVVNAANGRICGRAGRRWCLACHAFARWRKFTTRAAFAWAKPDAWYTCGRACPGGDFVMLADAGGAAMAPAATLAAVSASNPVVPTWRTSGLTYLLMILDKGMWP